VNTPAPASPATSPTTPPPQRSLPEHLRALRLAGRMAEAHAWLLGQARQLRDPRLAELAWQHEPFWWQPLVGPRVTLRRRGPDDLALVRRCWADAGFMARFNRMAAALPDGDDALRAMLQREQSTIVGEATALHWTIVADGAPVGFVSVVDITLGHRRAEYLIGIHGDEVSPWVGPEASHLALDFLARQVHIERLTAYFYPENEAAIRVAQKLGFVLEGTMRGYLRRSDGTRADLVVAGLLLDDAYFERHARMRRKLLGEITSPLAGRPR